MHTGKSATLLIATLLTLPSNSAVAEPVSTAQSADNGGALVVLLYDEHCKTWCEKVRPIMRELKEHYGNKVKVVELNTSHSALKESKKEAKELGVSGFLADYCDFVPYVGMFNRKRKLVKELQGPKEKDTYVQAIDKVLSEN